MHLLLFDSTQLHIKTVDTPTYKSVGINYYIFKDLKNFFMSAHVFTIW